MAKETVPVRLDSELRAEVNELVEDLARIRPDLFAISKTGRPNRSAVLEEVIRLGVPLARQKHTPRPANDKGPMQTLAEFVVVAAALSAQFGAELRSAAERLSEAQPQLDIIDNDD